MGTGMKDNRGMNIIKKVYKQYYSYVLKPGTQAIFYLIIK